MKPNSNDELKTLPDFDSLWDYDHPEQTELKFREIESSAKNSRNKSYYLQLLTQIARTQGLQRKFVEAHKTLDIVEKLLTTDLIQVRIRYLLERGRVYNSSKDKEKARPLFLEAWETANADKEDFYAIDAAHMMGIIEPSEQQLKWNLKALALAEKSSEPKSKKWLGSLYHNIGWTYHDLKQYDKALEIFNKGLVWRIEKKSEPEIRIAKWCIARTYRSMGKLQEAVDIQKELLNEIEIKKAEPDGYVFEELGECLLLMGQKKEAQKYFNFAYDILSKDKWLVANEPKRLERLKELGTEKF